MSLGLAEGTVVLVDHHTDWAQAYDQAAHAIATALPGVALAHIGSTAVAGLCAKPVLDLMLGLTALPQHAACIAPLAALGYQHHGEYGIAGRHYFTRHLAGLRTHHLHMVVVDSPFWREHLAFRDGLRSNPVLRADYAALKQMLARQYPTDSQAYAGAKTEFVRAALHGLAAVPSTGAKATAAGAGSC
ncbi:GrpB family protein [Chitinimonas viridis]|uniref:GrpB family protein n=1 Tax=Chitinimonas viridis TaxID=664880 RepID=A0ABT8B8K6_9NEIS|nr:GrpB family protein [Chitinimonas viridis]MDN3578573.1 GrpB family protein [Chitinimonas viridis]